MRIFINEYIKVLAYTFMGLLFAYSSFFLILNIYHYQEVRKSYSLDVADSENYKSIVANLKLIEKNLDVEVANYTGDSDGFAMATLQKNLYGCITDINNNSFKEMKAKKDINVKDTEALKNIVVNSVINSCLIEKLYYTTYDTKNIKFLSNDAILLKTNIDTINSEVDYINKAIMNNSSLSFNTTNSLNNVYNSVGDNYNNLLNLYKRSTDILLTVSSKFNKEVVEHD